MFGVLKSASCKMEPTQRQQWMGHVCGVCLGLKHYHGPICRIATNYDAALLSVLYDAQTPQPQAQRSSYCPLRNSFKMIVPAADNLGVRYAASMALMMASTKIQDHVHDAETGWRHIRRVATGQATFNFTPPNLVEVAVQVEYPRPGAKKPRSYVLTTFLSRPAAMRSRKELGLE